ncbi:sporulation membrane protein YtrI [Rossellomorea marisflavi]|uniref:Sporulation protein n=1 Tax=Rossellomorea marisflavi TaxID=189381 RepID=A0A0J5V9U9_9BACI|nr:sporulation membrane protein YtrI [Rossellomorea marisflavi]KMK94064.1 sporulation protein [Rossellomorea marisflavi]KML07412.1 sporulation protein [Rossellomorea marisflavi]KZE51893.1 sporulation protein [Rossellomorea marisflavi]MCM2604814.1 sporulation protein [Rossellomorea marisflavi]QHA37223.1 sporulation protein [Rossellomorea marisflavi]
MRIPPFYRLPSFQRFFAGAVIGGIVSWMIFIFMYGSMHEKQTQKIQDQQTQLDKLTSTLSYLQEENKELNEENEDELTIQEVRVKILNPTKTKVELLSLHRAEETLSQDLRSLLNQNLETAHDNKELIKKIIENKTIKLNDKPFRLEVKEIYFYTTTDLTLALKYEE